jgi:8-oxo-dGTP pyrophosphatase MutT (NUDIX family)
VSVSILPRLRAALAREGPPHDALSGIASAVLVPLYVRDADVHVLFTKRSDDMPHHSGQVSFPGGRHVAATDASLLDTALRETHEEIGVEPTHVDVLGALPPIHTSVTNFVINPFVGVIPYPYDFRPNPREVSDIFSVPLSVLADPAAALEEEWQLGDRRVPVTAFRHDGFVIWGATQRITAMLLETLAPARALT